MITIFKLSLFNIAIHDHASRILFIGVKLMCVGDIVVEDMVITVPQDMIIREEGSVRADNTLTGVFNTTLINCHSSNKPTSHFHSLSNA